MVTRSASVHRSVNRLSSPKTRSAPAAVRLSPVRRAQTVKKSKPRSASRLARSLTGLLALGAALGGARVSTPSNQPRMGGPGGPPETRVASYSGYHGPYYHSTFRTGPLSNRSLAVEVPRSYTPFFKGISEIERKLAPGGVIGQNLVKARPVYVSWGKTGPVHVGLVPRITPEQARVLESRGFRFHRNIKSKVMHGVPINPNLNLNAQTIRLLEAARNTGRRGLNVYPPALRPKIKSMLKANPYMVTFEPTVRRSLPK
jgi:hypothetical protein